ncbi:MAG: DUF554 domain-containing protein [Halanaerobiaceae bacterium]
MNGSIVNFFAILAGSILGVLFKGKFPKKILVTIMHGLGLAVILIGLQMALKTENMLIVIFSLVLGGIVGEIIDIEKRLNNIGEYIKRKFNSEDDLFVQGFVQSSLVFCVGAMAIMGSIQDGLNNDPTILFNKSILDGFASIAFSATSGIGVAFSAIPVLLYQGGITILASFVEKYLTVPMITEMTAVGGLLILGIGLNIMGIGKIKVGNLLPALVFSIILTAVIM